MYVRAAKEKHVDGGYSIDIERNAYRRG